MWKKLNDSVDYWSRPVLGNINGKNPIMALAVEKDLRPYLGLARVIVNRQGNPNNSGFLDISKLIIVESKDGLDWKKKGDLKIKGIDEIINSYVSKKKFFIGLEDPDIFVENGIVNAYFSIPFKFSKGKGYEVFLGHAQGKSLYDLKATVPTLHPLNRFVKGFKEVTISPIKYKGARFNLNEELVFNGRREVSVVSVSKCTDLRKLWHYIGIVLDPRKMKFSWISNEASPCCFLPLRYKGFLVGVVNGREHKKFFYGKIFRGKFRPGLFLFNPKTGEIPWIASEPLLEDPEAKGITFASDFLPLNKKECLLYCHVNDSFVRAYKINLEKLKRMLPKSL
ncbi:MAG: hypothetical protein AABW50_02410 [Nanoarchaeota archaeon]